MCLCQYTYLEQNFKSKIGGYTVVLVSTFRVYLVNIFCFWHPSHFHRNRHMMVCLTLCVPTCDLMRNYTRISIYIYNRPCTKHHREHFLLLYLSMPLCVFSWFCRFSCVIKKVGSRYSSLSFSLSLFSLSVWFAFFSISFSVFASCVRHTLHVHTYALHKKKLAHKVS